MKRIIKRIIAIFITLIIVNYNMCFADHLLMYTEPSIFGFGEFSVITSYFVPKIFLIGIILVIIEIVTYIYKKKKLEEINKIESYIYKKAILLALLESLYIFLFLFFAGGSILGIIFFIGGIGSIVARKKEHIKLANIVCGLVIILSIIIIFLS